MRGFLAEHSGAFDPNEIRILVAAFDKAWESVQARGAISGAEAESARAVLAKHIIAASEPHRVRWDKAASVGGVLCRAEIAWPALPYRLDSGDPYRS